ncbi:MAG: hypothetical protein AAFU80_10415 [Pseudomonadota bacterium]
MKAPPHLPTRRPSSTLRNGSRSRTDAAIELVRLEFDGERLRRELDQLEGRAARARTALGEGSRRAEALMRRLSKSGAKGERS